MTSFRFLLPVLALAGAAACTAPRTVLTSGKTTPVGEFRGGTNTIFNIPTNTTGRLADVLADGVREVSNKDSISYIENETVLRNLQKAALSWALDPLSSTQDIYLRYGVAERVDIGARLAAGAVVADAQYQLWGSTGSWRQADGAKGGHGSIGLMFATQSADLPGRKALDLGSKLLDFKARRTDILVPFTVSAPLGPEEEYGHVAAGVVVGRSFLRYRFKPTDRFFDAAGQRLNIPEVDERKSFMTYGLFVNGKFGYRYVFIQPALAVYFQNYGTYDLIQFDKTKPAPQATLKGATFVPSLGLQISIPTKRGK
ncbi:MAG: hypothetical protein H7330_14230 [Hymenobacteraceae bacterium]|nr:hypothetical protein [Hymenobacteraceae bacterium]